MNQFGNVSVFCDSFSSPKWYFKEKIIDNINWTPSDVLEISNIQKEQGGVYMCRGQDFYDDKFFSFYSITRITVLGNYELIT